MFTGFTLSELEVVSPMSVPLISELEGVLASELAEEVKSIAPRTLTSSELLSHVKSIRCAFRAQEMPRNSTDSELSPSEGTRLEGELDCDGGVELRWLLLLAAAMGEKGSPDENSWLLLLAVVVVGEEGSADEDSWLLLLAVVVVGEEGSPDENSSAVVGVCEVERDEEHDGTAQVESTRGHFSGEAPWEFGECA